MTELLSNTGFIMYNKALAHRLGVNEAILVGELCAKYQYWLAEGSLAEQEGWFYLTQRDVQEDTGLTPYQQRNAVQKLKDEGVLETKRSGNPAKLFFHLSEIMLDNLLSRNCTSSCEETAQLYIRNTKKETKKKSDVNQKKYSNDSAEMKLSDYLFAKIRENNPKAREPNWQAWAGTFGQMLRLDHREAEDIRDMIAFCQWHRFWKCNILSPGKLREKYDQLTVVRGECRKNE